MNTRATPWVPVNPPGFPHVGYSNAVIAGPGRIVAVAGQIDMGADGRVRHPGDLVAQVRGTFQNVLQVLAACGARPEHMVRARIYVVDADAWAREGTAIGAAWREAFGRWFPAMALVQVARLYDSDAWVEMEADAVLPD